MKKLNTLSSFSTYMSNNNDITNRTFVDEKELEMIIRFIYTKDDGVNIGEISNECGVPFRILMEELDVLQMESLIEYTDDKSENVIQLTKRGQRRAVELIKITSHGDT
ncbi:hypothetical protein D8Y20_12505 [Mariprofundus sp. EBB-1]|uniref:hypothetical protein n=1 Tax=Mariprofundus sp. EBB-1 TaxID=2650971 RepID=UPI000EF285D5|nr:hypothetical protein [Mariprofundus sp. EBB-1]RLL49807.1 hypothetical protein D8Y20_12505 [Mariprofundus sp. EBB-1]